MPRTRCPRTGRFNKFELTDDGTMDTVVRCSQCGDEKRFNYDPSPDEDINSIENNELAAERAYNAWVLECCVDAAEEHELNDGPEEE